MTQQIPGRLPGGGVDLSYLAARQGGAAGAGGNGQAQTGQAAPSGQTVDVPALVFEASDQTFQQVAQLSSVVPVIVELWSGADPRTESLAPALAQVAEEFAGRLVVARVDIDTSPGLAQALQVQVLPTAVALVNGQPVPLFQGAVPEEQIRQVFTQLIQLAVQQGVTGRVNAPHAGVGEPTGPQEPPVNPAHAEALEAIERGDYAAAVAAYEQVLLKAPADDEARAALVQVRLLARLQGVSLDEVRLAAASAPNDLEAQLRVADLDVSGGHVEDAFLRLLDFFAATHDDGDRTRIRERLLELFEVVGLADPRVVAARSRLANLLY